MYKSEPQSAAAAAASSSSVPSADDLKARIPLLQKMKQDDPRFGVLIRLLQDIASKPYDPSHKYQLMFKIIEIGNVFEILCKDIENKKPAEIAKTCGN